MKRSRTVKRMLLGSLTAGALSACAVAASAPHVTPETFFINDDHIPGAGYYHAPFRAFFPQAYNHYDPNRRMYFYGGQWGAEPHRSIVNISAPTPQAAKQAESLRTDSRRSGGGMYIPRSGFGSTSGSNTIRS